MTAPFMRSYALLLLKTCHKRNAPAIGGMAALILFIFLSWNVLPGVVFTNIGSVLFAAFLAGFSERYFLRVLNVDEEGKTSPSIANTSVSAPAISMAVVQTAQKDEAKKEDNLIVENPVTDAANDAAKQDEPAAK